MTIWLLQVPIIVQNDAVTALSGGTLGHLSGVILIAGTGNTYDPSCMMLICIPAALPACQGSNVLKCAPFDVVHPNLYYIRSPRHRVGVLDQGLSKGAACMQAA